MPAIVRTRGNSVAREQRRRAAVVLAREAATQVGPPGPLWVRRVGLAMSAYVRFAPASSTGQCNTACSLSAGVSKPKVFRGR